MNDVFLAICSGGLRRYLARRGELPETSLIAGCPVSLRRPDDMTLDNKVTMMAVSLGTDIADADARLEHVTASSRTAKAVTAEMAALDDVHLPWLPAQLAFAAQ